MARKLLGFEYLPKIAVAEGATTPDPGDNGVWAWSTTIGRPVYWNGTLWTSVPTSAGGGGGGIELALAGLGGF